jgi:serine/threonine-protein kinase RsbW
LQIKFLVLDGKAIPKSKINYKTANTNIFHLFTFKSWSMFSMVKRDHLTVKSDLRLLDHVQRWFEQFYLQYLAQFGWSKSQFYPLNLALTEGFTNAVRHAHHALPPETTIDIELSLWIDRLEMRMWDHGKPFNPDVVPEPKLDPLQEHGYGWLIMRRVADHVVYERGADSRNCLLIVKYAKEDQK